MRGTVEPTASGYTGAEVAAQILRQADITNIDIAGCPDGAAHHGSGMGCFDGVQSHYLAGGV